MLVRWRRKFWNEIVQQLQYYWFPDDSWVCYTHTHTYTYDIYYFFKNVRLYHLVQSGVTSTIWNSLMLPVPSGTVWCYQYHPVQSWCYHYHPVQSAVTSTIHRNVIETQQIKFLLYTCFHWRIPAFGIVTLWRCDSVTLWRWIFLDVSEDRSAFIFRISKSSHTA